MDRISALPFNSDVLVKLILQSELTPHIWKVVGVLKTSKEKDMPSQLSGKKALGLR